MTESEYSYLMTMYLGSDYCEAMSFFEYATRFGRQLIKNRSENDGRKTDVHAEDHRQ